MKYLVTGGTGFLGSHVVKLLAENGDEAVALDIQPDRERMEKLLGEENLKNVEIVAGDITDLDAMVRVCEAHKIEKIIHTAAMIGSENAILTAKVNAMGTIHVLEAARLTGVKKVAAASSVSVFGNPDQYDLEYIPNDAPHMPGSLYGATKSFNERCLDHYWRTYQLDGVAVRFTHIYGAGRIRGIGAKYDEELFVKPALGEPGVVPQGESIHNWIYVKDAARSLVLASRVSGTALRGYTATGYSASVAEVAELVRKLIPGADITLQPGKFQLSYKFDCASTVSDIGYEPQWTIEAGVKDFINEILKEQGKAPVE